jgi:hypothetical protein
MSFSFRLPEEDPVCECKYDEVHDCMDREDCPFHCHLVEDTQTAGVPQAERKPAASVATGTRQRSTRADVPRKRRVRDA